MVLTGAINASAAVNNGANEQAEAEMELAVEMTPPSTAIMKGVHKTNLIEQRSNAAHLFAFFADNAKDLAQLVTYTIHEHKSLWITVIVPLTEGTMKT